MKTKFYYPVAAVLAVIALFSFTFRPVDNPAAKSEELVKEWTRAKAYTKEYLDAATEEAYSFKPTPDMRSFRDQMMHLADANYGFLSAATGTAAPYKFGDLEKGSLKTKAEVTKAVLDSYDFAITGIKGLTDAALAANVSFFKMEMPAEVVLAKAFEHQTHHRGQTTVYLRLSKITPPKEMLF